MPRYHFNVRDGHEMPDEDGKPLPDDEVARQTGLTYLAKLLLERPEVWNTGSCQLTVTDASGLSLFISDVGVTASPATSAGRSKRLGG